MGAIHEKIPKVMAAVGAIGKDRKNVQQGYQFRGIDDLYNALNKALAENGVFTVPEVLEIKRDERTNKNGTVLFYTIAKIKYTFWADDGSSIEAITIGEGMDSGDKSCNKAMSGAQKYAFLQVFAIPTEEPKDSEIDHPADITPKPQQAPTTQPTSAQTSGQESKPMSEPQRKKLFAMMKGAGLENDECKDFFAFVNPKTGNAASQFIEHFETLKSEWDEARKAA